MNSEKYIGLDVHQATIVVAVTDSTGKLVMESILETEAATILQFFAGLRGKLAVTFEEGTRSAWLYDLLNPHVEKLVVCNPRKNALLKDGNKSDRIDARKLAELLRGNQLKPVYHGGAGREKYGHTALLRQVKGVGPITALAYVLTLENPQRFVKSRDVGPYLGLVPKQEDSGESQPQLGISKAGDTMVRKLLVGSAQYILGPFGPDTDLRRYGLRLCERGGKNAKKRAAVAVARKLAVLLHRLWVSGEVYEPLHNAMSGPIAAAA